MKLKKIKIQPRVKKTEADLAVFKLIINNQGKFILEQSMYPRDKIFLHFKKENSGLINAMLRECDFRFQELNTYLENIAKKLA